MTAAFARLSECLQETTGAPFTVELKFADSLSACGLSERPTVILASLLGEIENGDSLDVIRRRWTEAFSAIARRGFHICFVCTIFRHVAGADANAVYATRERIRRLNLFSADLSQETGVNVIDLDRSFSHLGARALATDFQLAGPHASAAFADAIASALLTIGLDDIVPFEILERALVAHSERKAQPSASQISMSADLLGYDAIQKDKRRQTFSRVPVALTPTTVGQLLSDLRRRRISWTLASQIILRKVRRLRGRRA
ncbi:hypothetical protein [Methylocapsa palsarum]|uniref:Uncharacterized protein n=1 Tax=Methylocapsa palsarum TaxID=1612308 RepID=A0A1I3YU38_9HYPH|nr:hypothetical protein [Methylocapsa palsarum]SFK35323.1 hypothetical protein SAMN05444581_106190 [Methylocapsa palsarum]